jgi:hypothetical protein
MSLINYASLLAEDTSANKLSCDLLTNGNMIWRLSSKEI